MMIGYSCEFGQSVLCRVFRL